MKFCRYKDNDQVKVGAVDKDGKVRDLSEHIARLDAETLANTGKMSDLAKVDVAGLPTVAGNPELTVPWEGISQFVCIGLNYGEHAAEGGLPIPEEPVIFLKGVSAVSGPYDRIVQPRNSTKMDWEVELGIVIGKSASYLAEDEADGAIAGYCVVNDVSERSFQMATSQWTKGKCCPTFGPLGPWLVTADEIDDPQNLPMWLDVNGVRMQDGNTADMIFGIRRLVSEVSHYMTLNPGDVIATGTPAGVGFGKKPNPIWLKPGDVVELGIGGLGVQRQTVVALNDSGLAR